MMEKQVTHPEDNLANEIKAIKQTVLSLRLDIERLTAELHAAQKSSQELLKFIDESAQELSLIGGDVPVKNTASSVWDDADAPVKMRGW